MRFAAQSSTSLAQISTTLIFFNFENCGANLEDIWGDYRDQESGSSRHCTIVCFADTFW